MIATYVLIFALATDTFQKSPSSMISQEFHSKETCESAGKSIAQDALNRGSRVLTWGCFKK